MTQTMEALPRTTLVRSGWQEQEIELLRVKVREAMDRGWPLKIAFETVAEQTRRKPNSVRNFYYTILRVQDGEDQWGMQRPPFSTFTPTQVRSLIKTVLAAQAQGISVRKCTMQMGGGDRSAMLRYQNKYRSVLRTHRPLVQEIITEMENEGIAYVDPYRQRRFRHTQQITTAEDTGITEHVSGLAWNLRQLEEFGILDSEIILDGLRTLSAQAAKQVAGRRKVEEFDALAARYDLLLMQNEQLKERCETLETQLARYE